MKLGIVGSTGAGRTTIFTLLSGVEPGADAFAGRTVTKVVRVPDPRLEHVHSAFSDRELKPASFQATDFGSRVSTEQRIGEERSADALLVVLSAFGGHDPVRVHQDLETEWTLLDLQSAERRAEKLEQRARRPIPPKERTEVEAELDLMRRIVAWVGDELPICDMPLDDRELLQLRPFGLFTLKPKLFLLNVDEREVPYGTDAAQKLGVHEGIVVCGKLESELALMAPAEEQEFKREFGIQELAKTRLIRKAYELLGLHSFFTIGRDEVRAWTVRLGTTAWEAAGEVHTDMQRGFIRAEVVAYDDFVASGSDMKRAKAANRVRLEGKGYVVRDADMIEFRFNV
ncbi:DUF933 domain-containing protein [Planctomycetota bacterium]